LKYHLQDDKECVQFKKRVDKKCKSVYGTLRWIQSRRNGEDASGQPKPISGVTPSVLALAGIHANNPMVARDPAAFSLSRWKLSSNFEMQVILSDSGAVRMEALPLHIIHAEN